MLLEIKQKLRETSDRMKEVTESYSLLQTEKDVCEYANKQLKIDFDQRLSLIAADYERKLNAYIGQLKSTVVSIIL